MLHHSRATFIGTKRTYSTHTSVANVYDTILIPEILIRYELSKIWFRIFQTLLQQDNYKVRFRADYDESCVS